MSRRYRVSYNDRCPVPSHHLTHWGVYVQTSECIWKLICPDTIPEHEHMRECSIHGLVIVTHVLRADGTEAYGPCHKCYSTNRFARIQLEDMEREEVKDEKSPIPILPVPSAGKLLY